MMDNGAQSRVVTQPQMERLAEWSMRKPVIALMGEFSAGKSTLLNLLVGHEILPTQVTATRLPPVWLRYGDGEPYRVDNNGDKHPVDLKDPSTIPMNDTRFIRVYCDADILKRTDLMDTPGISDPNIPVDNWIKTIGYANSVMWCTHAGQAWRESERSAWVSLPERLRQTSILLVTKKDKIVSETDLRKVERRLQREAGELFNGRVFISLTNAIRARENNDAAAWDASGAQDFAALLEQIIEGVSVQRSYMMSRYEVGVPAPRAPRAVAQPDAAPEPAQVATPTRVVPMRPAARAAAQAEAEAAAAAQEQESQEDVFVLHQQEEVAPEPIENDPFASLREPEPVQAPIENDPFAGLHSAAEPEQVQDDAAYEEPAEQFIRESYAAEQASSQVDEAPAQPADDTDTMISRIATMDTEEENYAADPEPVAAAPATRQRSEADMIREIWGDVQEHFDVSKTPTLVATINDLLTRMDTGDADHNAVGGASNGVSYGQMDTSGLMQPSRSF